MRARRSFSESRAARRVTVANECGVATRRAQRVAELIREEFGRILIEDLSDPRIGFVTVTGVEVSADLRTAKVALSVLGPAGRRRAAMRGLESALPHVRSLLGSRLSLRLVPEILLRLDEGVQHSVRINTILSQLAHERGETDLPDVADAGDEEEEGNDAIT